MTNIAPIATKAVSDILIAKIDSLNKMGTPYLMNAPTIDRIKISPKSSIAVIFNHLFTLYNIIHLQWFVNRLF
jgi:hypothetical protein